ncbi:E3 SUMO-protein ligase ZBED1 [Leucoraja erinacea]|uniref:E3 SUMO-protein ligase ZBED1 n=1 Tax=Leucoraja erinaceus TaxID=7782 RepID=UPI002455FD45|nr:E3 SUMO-protein ligase ZBED1 [Leucoraja erinacea]
MPPISEVWRYVTQRDDRTLECTMCGWQLAHPCSTEVLRLHLQNHHRIHFTTETGQGEPQGTDSTGDETQCEEEQGHSDMLDIDSPEPHRSPGSSSSSRRMSEMLRDCAAQLEDEEDEGPGDGDPHPTLTEDELSTLLRSCGPARSPRGSAELTYKRRLAGGSPDRAETWDFFKKLNERCVECSLCRKQLCFHASTASLREHLRRKHRLGEAQPRHGADDASSGSESVGPEPEVKRNRAVGERVGVPECPECPERRRDVLDRLLLGLVYRDLQPLGLGKQTGFKRLLGYLEPSYRPPTAAQLSAALRRLYLRARQHLAAQLRSVPALALSTHSWSGPGGRPFLTVLAHYTDARWATVRCALRTGRAPGPDLLLSALADYQLPAAAVICVVEDSPRARAEWPPYSLPCARRALDLCLRQTLRLEALQPALGAARRLAAQLQLGPDFGHGLEPLDIGLLQAGQWPEPLDTGLFPAGQWPEADTGPHWDNTLQMCERLLRMRPALDSEPALSPQHWQLLRDLVSVLQPLRLGLAFLSEPHNASVSALLPCLHGVAAALAQCPLEVASPARAAGARLRHLLLRRWELESGPDVATGPAGLAAIASFLDPRFKDLRFLDARTRDHIHRKVRALLAATPPEPRPASPCPPPLGPSPGAASPGPPPAALPSDYDLLFGAEPAGAMPESRLQLDGYLSEPLRKRDSDPFHWWRDNGHRFPALARLARRFLPIPAAAGPLSPRHNSTPAGGTDTDVEYIVFLHTNVPYIDLLQ